MRYTITGRNMELTDGLREAVENKIGRLDKFFAADTEAKVTMGTDGSLQRIEVTIPTKVGMIRAEVTGRDLYSSIDDAAEIIEKQIKKFKNRLIDKKQSALPFSQIFVDAPAEPEEQEIRIVKSKTFALKPMDPEEACLQMEMLGHDFFVFLNSETNEVNVVYKRKSNTYGLIEPSGDDED